MTTTGLDAVLANPASFWLGEVIADYEVGPYQIIEYYQWKRRGCESADIKLVQEAVRQLRACDVEIEKLRSLLARLIDAVAGEQEDPIELERALGKAAVPIIEEAREWLKGEEGR